jgi:hypothetical protein
MVVKTAKLTKGMMLLSGKIDFPFQRGIFIFAARFWVALRSLWDGTGIGKYSPG